jgi:hypothetical protein
MYGQRLRLFQDEADCDDRPHLVSWRRLWLSANSMDLSFALLTSFNNIIDEQISGIILEDHVPDENGIVLLHCCSLPGSRSRSMYSSSLSAMPGMANHVPAHFFSSLVNSYGGGRMSEAIIPSKHRGHVGHFSIH